MEQVFHNNLMNVFYDQLLSMELYHMFDIFHIFQCNLHKVFYVHMEQRNMQNQHLDKLHNIVQIKFVQRENVCLKLDYYF